MSEQNNAVNSLAHTKWNCKYHNERFGICGVFEREEQHDDIPEIREYEVCIPKPRILV